MAGALLKVRGGRQLRKALRQAGDDLEDLKAVHLKVGQVVAAAAKADAPRVTGKLAGSIRPNASKTRARIAVGNNRSTASGIPYAGPVHWGWPGDSRSLPRRIQRKAGWFITPNPWIVEAAQRTEPVWVNLYLNELDRIVDRVERDSNGSTYG